MSDLSAQRKLLDLVNVRCIQHQLGKPDDRAAADADAAQVRWDAVLDPDKGSAGSHADDHKLLLTLREIAAADAIGCKLINPVGRQSVNGLIDRAAADTGQIDLLDILQRQFIIIQKFTERAKQGGDGVVRRNLNRYQHVFSLKACNFCRTAADIDPYYDSHLLLSSFLC